LKKNTEDYRFIRNCLIVNLAWVHKDPIPNVAEDVGVSIMTVKRVLKEMLKPRVFENQCSDIESKWTK
jgi:hypothetical protein